MKYVYSMLFLFALIGGVVVIARWDFGTEEDLQQQQREQQALEKLQEQLQEQQQQQALENLQEQLQEQQRQQAQRELEQLELEQLEQAQQEPIFPGVWVSDAHFCPLLEQIGTRAIGDTDLVIIAEELGLVGYRLFCDFNEFNYGADGNSVEIAALCGGFDFTVSENFSLSLLDENSLGQAARLEFNSMFFTGRDGPEPRDESGSAANSDGANAGNEESRYLFTRCDNLSEQMLMERSET